MFANGIDKGHAVMPKDMANQRGYNDSLSNIYRELAPLERAGIVEGGEGQPRYLADWVLGLDPEEIIRQNPELNQPALNEDEATIDIIRGRVKKIPDTKNSILTNETALSPVSETPKTVMPTILQINADITFSFQFKVADKPERIFEFVTADTFTKGGFANPDIFQRYMDTLVTIQEPGLNEAMNAFLKSEYGEKFIKALARLEINNLIIDVIDPNIWDDYDYAFAVRNIITQNNTLYISIPYLQIGNAEDRGAEIARWLVLPMRYIWESRWGYDTLIMEGIYFQEDNPMPIVSAPKIPQYFCLLEMLRRSKVLPEQICFLLQGQAYSKYFSELKIKSQNLSQDELAAMLWDQLKEAGESTYLLFEDKHTHATYDININVVSPDFRLRSEQPKRYASLIRRPKGIELQYIVNPKSWDRKNSPFLSIDASTFFRKQIVQSLHGLSGQNLAEAAKRILSRIYGFDKDLCCRLIRDAAEADVLKFINDNAHFVDDPKYKGEGAQVGSKDNYPKVDAIRQAL